MLKVSSQTRTPSLGLRISVAHFLKDGAETQPTPRYRFFLNLLADFISCPSPICKMSPLSQKTKNQKHHQEKMCCYYEFKVKERQNIEGSISTKTRKQWVSKTTNGSNILHGFKCYRGGWNITNRHYWAVSICFFCSL